MSAASSRFGGPASLLIGALVLSGAIGGVRISSAINYQGNVEVVRCKAASVQFRADLVRHQKLFDEGMAHIDRLNVAMRNILKTPVDEWSDEDFDELRNLHVRWTAIFKGIKDSPSLEPVFQACDIPPRNQNGAFSQ